MKYTLIKIIQGVLKPLEKDSIKMSYNKLAYIPQNGNLLPYLTIRDNIKLHYKIVTKKKITEEELKNSLKLASLEEIYLDSYLTGTDKDNLYYQITQKEDNVFVILNKRTYLKSNLTLTFSCVAPNNKECKQELAVRLGGNY